MPLNWNIDKCRDWEELNCGEEWPATNTAIWMSLISGYAGITEDNWADWYARVALWGRVVDNRDDDPLTPEQVHRRIGLSTNCWPSLTQKEWVKDKLGIDRYLAEIKGNGIRAVEKADADSN